MLNNKGFTMTEILLVMLLSGGAISTAFVIPTRMAESYAQYNYEMSINLDHDVITTHLDEDLNNHQNAIETETGFQIGSNKYEFSSEGLFKKNQEEDIQLTSKKLQYEIVNGWIHIYSEIGDSEDNKTELNIKLPMSADYHLTGGASIE